MNDEFVPVWIAKLCHPTDRRLSFLEVERDAALFKLGDRRIDILHLERDRRSIAGGLPRRMTTDANGRRPKVVLDPRAFHRRVAWFQFEGLLIKLASAFLVRNGNGDECNLLDHLQIPFSLSGFNLWMINLFPSGSCTTLMWQHGVSNGSAAKRTCRSFNRMIASSKSSTSSAAPVP